MDNEFDLLKERMDKAKWPEEIFGDLAGVSADEKLRAGRAIYRRLALVTHPDAYKGSDLTLAQDAFRTLNMWWELAQQRINDGCYGTKEHTPVRIKTRRHEFTIGPILAEGDLAILYQCRIGGTGKSKQGVFKIAQRAADNDLLETESRVLRQLRSSSTDPKYHAYIPEVIDSFPYLEPSATQAKQATILAQLDGFYSLTEVMQAYPNGLDPQDMTWMWRRLLVVLGYAHQNRVIHGAVLPPHIMIHPEEHGLVLVDWAYAVCDAQRTSSHIKAVSTAYSKWYPSEVFNRTVPMPGLDIFMGARCMVALLGGDPLTGTVPDSVPSTLRNFFRGCLLQKPSFRPQEAWKLLQEYDEAIYSLWGQRRFRPFAMPTAR